MINSRSSSSSSSSGSSSSRIRSRKSSRIRSRSSSSSSSNSRSSSSSSSSSRHMPEHGLPRALGCYTILVYCTSIPYYMHLYTILYALVCYTSTYTYMYI